MSREINQREIATLGGGCFWCLEAVFTELKGVEKVESGYCGGTADRPTYRQVCSGTTGHAEAVQVTFDPKAVGFKEILDVFFVIHDPTNLNRQGSDTGTQYRSVIFHHTPEQKAIAEKAIKEINAARIWNGPVVTELAPFKIFYRAEDHHQDYYKNNPEQMYCRMVIEPKVAKFRKQFIDRLKK